MKEAPAMLETLRKVYTDDSQQFDFNIGIYISGDHNKLVRQELIRLATNVKLPLTKCGEFAVSTALRNYFNQLTIF